jgi:hypothetical protein
VYDHTISLSSISKKINKVFQSFGLCLFAAWIVVLCMGRKIFSFSSIYLLLTCSKPPQMPPHRENNNDNNNNLYDVIQQLATCQAQLMQAMTQFIQASANIMNNNNNPPPPPPPPQVDRLAHFFRLRPNKFSSAIDPIVADDWLSSVNKDLVTCECTDAEKIRFTAHLLEGPATMWWETYQVTNPIEGLD